MLKLHIFSLIDSENDYTLFTTTLMTTTEKISNKLELSRRGREFENTATEKELHNSDNINDFNLSSELIEHEDGNWSDDTKTSNVNLKPPNIIEPEINDYNVDELDKNIWKPRLVFENKTKTTTASSVIMKISPENTDIELFNIEAAPFQEG